MKSKLKAIGSLYVGMLTGLSITFLSVIVALFTSASSLEITVEPDQNIRLKMILSAIVLTTCTVGSIKASQLNDKKP